MGLISFFKRKKKPIETPFPSSPPANHNPVNSNPPIMPSRARIEEELEQVFKKFDVNGDGKISWSELGSIMSSLGHPANEEELQSMIKEVDSDGDGFIDLTEFIALNTYDIGSDDNLESLKNAFSVFDIDKNGSITAEELQNVLQSLGEDCSLSECRKMITGVDCNGDGMICFDEFKIMMTKGWCFQMDERFVSQDHTLKKIRE